MSEVPINGVRLDTIDSEGRHSLYMDQILATLDPLLALKTQKLIQSTGDSELISICKEKPEFILAIADVIKRIQSEPENVREWLGSNRLFRMITSEGFINLCRVLEREQIRSSMNDLINSVLENSR